MEKKCYTVLEIAQRGKEKFEIDLKDTRALEKQIRLVIRRENIQPIDKKKSTPRARNDANAYSEADKDRILDDFLFDYLRNMSNNEAVKKFKSSAEYQKMADEANEKYLEELERWTQEEAYRANYGNFPEREKLTEYSEEVKKEKDRMVREALFSSYISSEGDLESVETLSKAAYLSQVFVSQFVTERLFSELFDFEMDEFVRDADKSNYIAQNSIGGDFGVEEMKLFDKLSNWRNYVSLKRE
ncbi:hypothetical protein [Lactococcus petauri]|uniref:hypothetical protein n=1 Tax=Lactococcus petauri TaxID=1940789 RepID=UPI00254B27D4|nr:hypothetical protein [Lactococcus petauri]